MNTLNILAPIWVLLSCLLFKADVYPLSSAIQKQQIVISPTAPPVSPVICDCTITQSGQSYAVSAFQGTTTAANYYSYGNPLVASANTGHEIEEGLILFLYENTNTGIISLFLIADIGNDATGGALEFEINCLPATAYVSVEDDPGEFSGVPPIITGNWNWSPCCTDGGVIEDIGCDNTINLDLLVSSGIDSILWLTGDINNPNQILLNLSGEAITISCGSGGICCPIGLDTEVNITHATCPDTPNGSIDINPQDGFPGYFYNWSNGSTDEDLTGLTPGVYSVTVTDSQGCTEEIDITVDVTPGDPLAQPASLEICSETTMALFDLTTVNDIINLGSGFDVLWFQNQNLTGPIADPSNYFASTSIVYAVVDNGFCLSDPVAVELTVLQSPIGTATNMNVCEEMDDMATFDLTSLDQVVSGGAGNVLWYLDPLPANLINDPSNFYSSSTIVYAVVDDGICQSEPVEVELIVDPKPEGFTTSASLCGDENDEAVFDLIDLEDVISMGNGVVEWYIEIELLDPIFFPGAFVTSTTTVYAVVFDGVCYSDPVPVDLTVHPTPVGNSISIDACDIGSGVGLFNLTDFENLVSGGEGIVNWYLDEFLTDIIPDPESFLSQSTVIFATIENEYCISDYVQIELNVIQSPSGNDISIETCADSTGQGIFDLTASELEITGGFGTVLWYEDDLGQFIISTPSAYASTGEIVYAQITLGVCLSDFIPIELILINSVNATPAQLAACDDGTGNAIFNLPTIADSVSSGSGQVIWYLDMNGMVLIPNPSTFYSGDSIVYARVVAGDCASDIVPVDLIVIQSPVAIDTTLSFCGDGNQLATIDLTAFDSLISDNSGSVSWYLDLQLMTIISDPISFSTSSSIVYASVSNGACTSPTAAINITVSLGFVANATEVQVCVTTGDTITIDLTQWDSLISIIGLQVNWFADSNGLIEILSPETYGVSMSDTVYVNVSDSACVSSIIPIEITALEIPVPMSTDIKKCGDGSGEVIVDLTSVDALVSGNIGNVMWYADPGQSILINNPTMLTTGDTTVYAVVTNGFCTTASFPVTVTVVDSLLAAPQQIEVCLLDSDTADLDLTQYNLAISGGSGPVIWFTDSLMTDTIFNPSTFTTTGDSLYVIIVADGCTSNVALVTIEIGSSSFPTLDCAFTSIDSVSITWPDVADEYEITYLLNGQLTGTPVISTMTEFNLGGLAQNDSISLSVTSLYNSICTQPLTTTIICVTDICPSQSFSFGGLKPDYCKDETGVPLNIIPAGGTISGQGIIGDTLYPGLIVGSTSSINYGWEETTSGCVYDTTVLINFFDPLLPPDLICQSDTTSEVSFSWSNTSISYGYSYVVNQGVANLTPLYNNTTLTVNGLNEGDEVTLMVWAIGPPPCGNSDTVTVSCNSKVCPPATIEISAPGSFCSVDDPVQLEAMITGLSGMENLIWSGPGIANPIGEFNPMLADFGINTISLEVEEDGCYYNASIDLTVYQQPIANIDISGDRCINRPFHVEFFGVASDSATFHYDLDGAEVVAGVMPYDFSVAWSIPGTYTIGLAIDDQGCISNDVALTFIIDEPLQAPDIICMEEDFTSVVVEWEPVPGALTYSVTSSAGTGVLLGTIYTLTDLKDDSPVRITVTPIGNTECASPSTTIECHTLMYIPANVYIPNVFSPNGDGLNDIFYLQSNNEITIVSSLRIYDRWGNEVFEEFDFLPDDPEHGWDGTHKGELMNPAVFIYVAEVQTLRGETVQLQGDITLVR